MIIQTSHTCWHITCWNYSNVWCVSLISKEWKFLTGLSIKFCLWALDLSFGSWLAGSCHLIAVEILDCHQLLFIHHPYVCHSRGRANILKRTVLVGCACVTIWAYDWGKQLLFILTALFIASKESLLVWPVTSIILLWSKVVHGWQLWVSSPVFCMHWGLWTFYLQSWPEQP